MRIEPRFKLRADRDITAPEPESSPEDYAPKSKELEPPSESAIAAEKAAAAVIYADKLEAEGDAMIDAVNKRAEQLTAEWLRIKSDFQERRAVLQSGADSFLERTAKWQTGLRELFAATDTNRKENQ